MDFDGNGRLDILSGSWPGQLYLFRRQEDGTFATPEKLTDRDGDEIKVGSASAVFACDWNGNGRLDLLVGNIGGEVHLIVNEGTREEPLYGPSVKLKAGGNEIRVPGGDAGPFVADWDGDGLPDLLVGNGDGSVHFYRNVGSREEPELAAAEVLVPAPPRQARTEAEEGPRRGTRAKICVTDWNGDGRLDLLVGDFSSEAIREPEPEPDETEPVDRKALLQKWSRVVEELAGTLRGPEGESDAESRSRLERQEELRQEMTELRRQLTATQRQPVRHEYRGWVWVFLRQGPDRVADADRP